MNLKFLNDSDLLTNTKNISQRERDCLVEILHHLREIERRRLFSDLGFKSLFEYAVRELKYSEGQASRRITAMRLIKEIPEVEEKVASGALSLSNAQKAQSLFKHLDAKAENDEERLNADKKRDILGRLEGKSVRDAEKEIAKIAPQIVPVERERVVAEDKIEVKFVVDDVLKVKLEEVRSLLGVKGLDLSYAQLIAAMADLSIASLKAKRFGKRRSQESELLKNGTTSSKLNEQGHLLAPSDQNSKGCTKVKNNCIKDMQQAPKKMAELKLPLGRYIPREIKALVWNRNSGCCQNCGSRRNLNFDHIVPVALGGKSEALNLRLLCFPCNQRARDKIFGKFDLKAVM
jgi:hypothetical protein